MDVAGFTSPKYKASCTGTLKPLLPSALNPTTWQIHDHQGESRGPQED